MSEATKSAPAPVTAAARQHAGRAVLAYAVAVYLFLAGVLAYSIGFFIGFAAPKGIDQGSRWPVLAALVVDLAVLGLFAVQHTVMARPWFKRWWTRRIPEPAERATFVLAASAILALTFWAWRPFGPELWHLSGAAAGVLLAVYAAGWLIALSSTFLISHADLFGLRQAWLSARGTPYTPPAFTERGLYRQIRHPLMAGFVIVFWATPVLTAGHLLFAAAATGYIAVGIAFEEHDLRLALGEAYTAYRARVPALVPGLRLRLRLRRRHD
jgi:protein-S-isoprenylcysteine O-methyltransferase Ste14